MSDGLTELWWYWLSLNPAVSTWFSRFLFKKLSQFKLFSIGRILIYQVEGKLKTKTKNYKYFFSEGYLGHTCILVNILWKIILTTMVQMKGSGFLVWTLGMLIKYVLPGSKLPAKCPTLLYSFRVLKTHGNVIISFYQILAYTHLK